MISIDLEENNDDCVLVEVVPNEPKESDANLKFKRKLIFKIRANRLLYDGRHKHFSNVAKKDLVWQQIANELNSTVSDCKDTWFQLRYDYQRFARRLRNYFINGHKENRKRPAMYLESELMFLWGIIETRKTCKIPLEVYKAIHVELEKEIECKKGNETTNNIKSVDDDLILIESPVELIVIDEDDDNGKSGSQFKLSPTIKMLISQIKDYPELYDCEHRAFTNYTRKSYIWNAIANNLGDKATKLMKSWIIVQTRYEWEICQSKQTADQTTHSFELHVHLDFLKNFILKNPNTVYKQSYYLKTAWYDPIDYFKDIYNLIARMKKIPDILHITDALLKVPEKSKKYLSLWTDIAILKGSTAGQCETTWLTMRHFYWELMYMRQQNYQLTDKWYFETIITELYALSRPELSTKPPELPVPKQSKAAPTASKRPAQTNAISLGAPSVTRSSLTSTTTPITPTIINNLQSIPTMNSTQPTPSNAMTPSLTLPKITAAISLAPQSLNSGALQIKQISGPPTLSPAPKSHNVLNDTAATTFPTTTAVPPQMSMPYSLPTQTKMTPVLIPPLMPLMPPITQSAVRNATPTMISVRPGAYLRPPPPSANIQPWSTVPTVTIHSMAKPQTTSDIKISTVGSVNSNTSAYTTTKAPTTTQSIASSKVTTVALNNNATSSTNPALVTNDNIETPPPSSTTANSSQLPKIIGAMSLLNPNEILIELIASHYGNQLVVHGPPLSSKYQLSMRTVAKFIRAVLAIPLLHNKQNNSPEIMNYYWEHISSNFNLPVHICRACWNFLLENFNHFPQIAPMKELMKPFQTTIKVWNESNSLFKQFDEYCVSKGWLQYMQSLPDVVDCISGYSLLYRDVAKPNNEKLSDMETLCAWRTIRLRFPKIPEIQEIWAAFKTCFCKYMVDLEFGIDNKWSITWWRSFARMKFLVEAKYSSNEPFFYIVSNKMLEEIDKCAMIEMKTRYKTGANSPNLDNETIQKDVEVNQTKNNNVISTLMEPNTRIEKEIELGTLLTAIQKHPVIFGNADNFTKYEAWKKVAEELHMQTIDCLLSFKHATEMYFAYKKQDTVSRCRINEKYYKKLDEIVRSLPSSKFSTIHGKINIKTPFELNQTVDTENSSDLMFPERYISDISMSNSPSNLVVKNWCFALGNIVFDHADPSSLTRLKGILHTYLQNVTFSLLQIR